MTEYRIEIVAKVIDVQAEQLNADVLGQETLPSIGAEFVLRYHGPALDVNDALADALRRASKLLGIPDTQ